jgi:hypothetical protein
MEKIERIESLKKDCQRLTEDRDAFLKMTVKKNIQVKDLEMLVKELKRELLHQLEKNHGPIIARNHPLIVKTEKILSIHLIS